LASVLCIRNGRFEPLTAVKIQVEVFWVVTLCCFVIGYQRFRGSCCLHGSLKHNTTRRNNPEDLDLNYVLLI
jgi:hypothetical protein